MLQNSEGPLHRLKVRFVRRADIGSPSFGALAANGSFVREAVIASAKLAAAVTNDRFCRCRAAMP